jgi:hypothetical protein
MISERLSTQSRAAIVTPQRPLAKKGRCDIRHQLGYQVQHQDLWIIYIVKTIFQCLGKVQDFVFRPRRIVN